jgi:hypothetical protein
MPYGKTPAKMGHKDSAMEMSPYKMESAKQERKDLLQDNPVVRDASGGRSWMSKHSKSGMGSAMKMGHSPMEKHDGKKFEDKGFMDSHFPSGAPRK